MTSSPGPDVVPPRARVEYALELVSILALSSTLAFIASSWDALPERVPTHFGASGLADAYGSKNTIVTPAVLALGSYVLFSLVQWIPPRFYNYPLRISADNAVTNYRLARIYLALIKAAVSVILAVGTWQSVEVALGQRQGLASWFLPVVLLLPVPLLVSIAYLSYRQRKE